MSEPTYGEKIQAHVNIAVGLNQEIITLAAHRATKAGVGVWVKPIFTEQGIRIEAEPNVRVPVGHIQMPDFTKMKDPNETRES